MSASPSRPNFRRQFKSGIACVSYETTLQIFPPFSWLSLGCTIHGRCWRRDCTQLVHNLPLRQTTQREPKPIHNPNNGRRQEAGEGEGGKCVVVAVAVGSFTNLGHRRREGETEEEEECRARTGKASSGRRQKRWEKSQWQSVSRRRLFSKGILESANRGPSASAAAAYFLPISQAAAGCQNQICHGSSFHSLKRGFLGSNLVR